MRTKQKKLFAEKLAKQELIRHNSKDHKEINEAERKISDYAREIRGLVRPEDFLDTLDDIDVMVQNILKEKLNNK